MFRFPGIDLILTSKQIIIVTISELLMIDNVPQGMSLTFPDVPFR